MKKFLFVILLCLVNANLFGLNMDNPQEVFEYQLFDEETGDILLPTELSDEDGQVEIDSARGQFLMYSLLKQKFDALKNEVISVDEEEDEEQIHNIKLDSVFAKIKELYENARNSGNSSLANILSRQFNF